MPRLAYIFLACCAAALTAFGAVPVELLGNNTFETLDDGGWPQGWPKGKNVSCVEEDGNHFVRIKSSGVESMDMLYRRVALPPRASAVKLSLRVRHDGVKSGAHEWNDARIIVNAIDAEGKKSEVGAPYFRGTSDGWKDVALDLRLPFGAVALELIPCMFNASAGTLDIDDLSLVVTSRNRVAPTLKDSDTLVVKGNRIVTKDGRELHFRGLNIPSLEWNWRGEKVLESAEAAVETWHANLLRIAVHPLFWFGRGAERNDWNKQDDGGEGYRKIVDSVIAYANDNGCYVMLDLHCYRAPTQAHADFWADAAARYANSPGVIFDLLNEPHGTSWAVWRDGGDIPVEGEGTAVHSIGMQALVDAVRATGAKNIVVCGGLDWAYDLTGVAGRYALVDESGNGIAYSAHIYPWKEMTWDEAIGAAARKYPVIVGEVGCQDKPMPWETEAVNPYKWAPAMLSYLERNGLHWVAWSFHPGASPCVISDWDFSPTPCWGAFVRAVLEGARFQDGNGPQDKETLP